MSAGFEGIFSKHSLPCSVATIGNTLLLVFMLWLWDKWRYSDLSALCSNTALRCWSWEEIAISSKVNGKRSKPLSSLVSLHRGLLHGWHKRPRAVVPNRRHGTGNHHQLFWSPLTATVAELWPPEEGPEQPPADITSISHQVWAFLTAEDIYLWTAEHIKMDAVLVLFGLGDKSRKRRQMGSQNKYSIYFIQQFFHPTSPVLKKGAGHRGLSTELRTGSEGAFAGLELMI